VAELGCRGAEFGYAPVLFQLDQIADIVDSVIQYLPDGVIAYGEPQFSEILSDFLWYIAPRGRIIAVTTNCQADQHFRYAVLRRVSTPRHDGMNLVAKEYVAAQNAADPGVMVVSKFAGRRQRARHGAAGQSSRHRRHGADDRDRALDALDRAADALGSDDGEASRRHDPAMVCRFR
jgi:hypothetical protein